MTSTPTDISEKRLTALTQNPTIKALLSGIFIISGIFIVFSNLKYNFYLGDENYQAVCVKDYAHNPMALLSFWTGHVWCQLFGFSLLSLRILSHVLMLISIATGSLFLRYLSKSTFLASTVFLLCCLLSDLGAFPIFNWDTGGYPAVALWGISIVYYGLRPSVKSLILLGVITGFVALCRLPLASFSLLDLVLIIYTGRRCSRSARQIVSGAAIGLAAMLLTMFVVGSLICGSPSNYIASFNPDNVITGHGSSFINHLIWRIKILFPFVFLSWSLISAAFIGAYFAFHPATSRKRFVISLLVCILIGWAISRINALTDGYSNPIFGLSFPLIVVAGFLLPNYFLDSKGSLPKQKHELLKVIGLLLIGGCLLMGLGSDTAFERWVAIFLFPSALAICWKPMKRHSHQIIWAWLLLCILSTGLMWVLKTLKVPSEFIAPSSPIASRGDLPLHNLEKFVWDNVPQEIARIKAENKSYTFWGSFRYPLMLEFEPTPRYSYQLYHNTEFDIVKDTPQVLDCDYVFVTYLESDTMMDKPISALQSEGYQIIEKTPYYTLLKK